MTEAGTASEERGDIGHLAGSDGIGEEVGVRAVEHDGDHVAGRTRRRVEDGPDLVAVLGPQAGVGAHRAG